MSTAVLEPAVEQAIVPQPATKASAPAAPPAETQIIKDPHPLLPVVVAGIIALHVAGAFVGSIVVWLLLRNTGVMAP